jgi:uncharacterized protein
MSLVYIDTSCIIYLLEASGPIHHAVTSRLARHGASASATLVSSRLARLECRTKPLREANLALLARYETFFGAQRFQLVDVSPMVIERATDLRVKHGFKTPDALHLATAIIVGADVVLTGDQQFERCTEVSVEVVTAHP